MRRVAGEGVEQRGAGQAQDGADEEEQEDQLVGHVDVLEKDGMLVL